MELDEKIIQVNNLSKHFGNKAQLIQAMSGCVIEKTALMGIYAPL